MYSYLQGFRIVTKIQEKMVYLSDYLGCIRSISEIVPYGDANTGQKYRRKVESEILDDNIVEFTMWDDLAHQFNKVEIEKRPFPRMLAVSSCKVGRYRDLLQLTATSATHFYVNPRIQEVTEVCTMFKEKYNLNPPLQVVRYPYTDLEQEKMRNRQTLASLLQQNPATFKGIRFTCEATLTSINKYKAWNYASCEKCSKASTLQDETYYCANHGKQEPVTYRHVIHMYKFKATATDGTATAEFTFFTIDGQKLTRKPCGILKDSLHTVEEHQLPVKITDTIGKPHIFKIQYEESSQKGFGRFVVNDVLDIPTPSANAITGVNTDVCSSNSQPVEDVYPITQTTTQVEDIGTPIREITGTPSEEVTKNIAATPKITEDKGQPTKRSLDKEFSVASKKPKADYHLYITA